MTSRVVGIGKTEFCFDFSNQLTVSDLSSLKLWKFEFRKWLENSVNSAKTVKKKVPTFVVAIIFVNATMHRIQGVQESFGYHNIVHFWNIFSFWIQIQLWITISFWIRIQFSITNSFWIRIQFWVTISF